MSWMTAPFKVIKELAVEVNIPVFILIAFESAAERSTTIEVPFPDAVVLVVRVYDVVEVAKS